MEYKKLKMTSVRNIKKFINELESILYSLHIDDAVWNEFDTITERYLGNKIHEILQEDITDEIAIVWHIEDVRSIRPDLTNEQASKVLVCVQKNHDATVGINWDTLEVIADDLYPSCN